MPKRGPVSNITAYIYIYLFISVPRIDFTSIFGILYYIFQEKVPTIVSQKCSCPLLLAFGGTGSFKVLWASHFPLGKIGIIEVHPPFWSGLGCTSFWGLLGLPRKNGHLWGTASFLTCFEVHLFLGPPIFPRKIVISEENTHSSTDLGWICFLALLFSLEKIGISEGIERER